MKKFSMILATFVLTATCAQSQTQPGQTSSGTTGVQPDTRQLLPGQTPSQPGVINGQTTGRVIPNTPNPVPFGGTNQVTFGTTNPPFASTNQGFASTNAPRFGTNINEAAGAANPGSLGATNSAALADQAFTQQLRAALARPGATQIYFPQTRSTVTVMNQNGVVTLQGLVANEAERRNLEARIKNTDGVISVLNQLQIAGGQNQGGNPLLNPAPGAAAPGTETNRQLLNP